MSLNYRRMPVLVVPEDKVIGLSKIVDLRIIWTVGDVVSADAEHTGLQNGQTTLDIDDDVLIFRAKHPLYDIYYTKTIPLAGPVPFLVQGTSTYDVDGGERIYYVKNGTGDVLIYTKSCYVGIDYDADYWVFTYDGVTYNTIEPFNTIFAPLLANETTIFDQHSGKAVSIDKHTFTNTPMGGKALYTFDIAGGGIALNRDTSVQQVTGNQSGIRSINGVQPVGGNINIKLVGGSGGSVSN